MKKVYDKAHTVTLAQFILFHKLTTRDDSVTQNNWKIFLLFYYQA